MNVRTNLLVPALSFVVLVPLASAQRAGSNGTRGTSSPRSGLGIRSNPIVNPAPSLTPSQVLNPRGSLSTGQVLNPAPSLRRPRSGGPTVVTQQALPSARQPGRRAPQYVTDGGSSNRNVRRESRYSAKSHFDQFNAELRRFKNGQSWAEYLVPSQELLSDASTEGASDELRRLLRRFDKIASDATYARVTALPAFWPAHESLKLKVGQSDPTPAQPVGDRDSQFGDVLSSSFDQLFGQLREYTNGDSWASYLALPKELIDGGPTQAKRESTERLLKRFERISGDPTYAEVTSLIAFRPAYEALKLSANPAGTSQAPTASAAANQGSAVFTGQPPVAPTEAKPVTATPSQLNATAEKARAAAADKDKTQVAAQELLPRVAARSEPDNADHVDVDRPVGEKLLKSVMALDQQLAKVAPGKDWSKRLSINQLEATVGITSDRPGNDSDRESLEEIRESYQEIANDKGDAVVNELTEFKDTLEALQRYLSVEGR